MHKYVLYNSQSASFIPKIVLSLTLSLLVFSQSPKKITMFQSLIAKLGNDFREIQSNN